MNLNTGKVAPVSGADQIQKMALSSARPFYLRRPQLSSRQRGNLVGYESASTSPTSSPGRSLRPGGVSTANADVRSSSAAVLSGAALGLSKRPLATPDPPTVRPGVAKVYLGAQCVAVVTL